MKLRILGNSLRLRLSQSEVDQIGQGKAVEVSIDFPKSKLTYRLATSDSDEIQADYCENRISVELPNALAQSWANSNEVCIKGEYEGLTLLIEKDFKCLTDRDENESDLFANPNSVC